MNRPYREASVRTTEPFPFCVKCLRGGSDHWRGYPDEACVCTKRRRDLVKSAAYGTLVGACGTLVGACIGEVIDALIRCL